MHHVDVNKMKREKARWELYQNATNFGAQIQEATLHKTTALQPHTSHLTNHLSKKNKTCRTLLEKQGPIHTDVLLWTPHIDVPVLAAARSYLHQLCAYTCFSLEDLPRVMERKRERVSGKLVLSVRLDDDDDITRKVTRSFLWRDQLMHKLIYQSVHVHKPVIKSFTFHLVEAVSALTAGIQARSALSQLN